MQGVGSGVKRDVGPVEACIFVGGVGVGWVLCDGLFDEWALFCDTENEVGEIVS